MTPAPWQLDHLAWLVPSLEEALPLHAPRVDGPPGPIETFPAEGTRERYLGEPGRLARTLLLEATGPGPYLRALQRHGPGLHHLGLRCQALEPALARLDALGWLLHRGGPDSGATRWLLHPTRPCRLELFTSASRLVGPPATALLRAPGDLSALAALELGIPLAGH